MMNPLGISIIDNAFTDCATVLDYCRDQEWNRSRTGDGNINEIRQSDSISVPMLSWQNPDAIHSMNRIVWQQMDNYAQEWDFAFSSIEDVSIQRYEPGQGYGAHVDTFTGMPRIVSAVLYLNTIEDGGETYFNHFDYGVKPVAGRLAIFPSNYIYRHEAKPPIKETKIAAAYWARS